MKATLYSALTASALVLAPALQADQADCLKVADVVKKQVEADADEREDRERRRQREREASSDGVKH